MDLDPVVAAAGVRLVTHDTIGSTNSEALALARTGERGPLWITAERQTAGRGRRGRGFVSERGNLHASLLLTDPAPVERAAELSFVAALALRDAIAAVAGSIAPRLTLKWPNDLLCDGSKLAGILVEGETGTDRPLAIVVGIGVNCVRHPAGTAFPATDLAAAGASVGPATLFGALSAAMVGRLAQWDRGRGFGAIRAAWLGYAFGLGKPIRVVLADREFGGRFETLDEYGRLVVRTAEGALETVTAGDVFPIESAPAGVPWSTDGSPQREGQPR